MDQRKVVSTGVGVIESSYRPNEVIVYGLNLEAADKQTIEQLGIQYVDQRRSFAKLEPVMNFESLIDWGHYETLNLPQRCQ